MGTIGYGSGSSKEKVKREEAEKRDSGSAAQGVKMGAVIGAAVLVGIMLL